MQTQTSTTPFISIPTLKTVQLLTTLSHVVILTLPTPKHLCQQHSYVCLRKTGARHIIVEIFRKSLVENVIAGPSRKRPRADPTGTRKKMPQTTAGRTFDATLRISIWAVVRLCEPAWNYSALPTVVSLYASCMMKKACFFFPSSERSPFRL